MQEGHAPPPQKDIELGEVGSYLLCAGHDVKGRGFKEQPLASRGADGLGVGSGEE